MIEFVKQALYKVEIGVIIIDNKQRIKFWNNYIEKLSGLSSSYVIEKKLPELCPAFNKPMIQGIFDDAFERNLCRFCSSKLHKAFIYPSGIAELPDLKQNMKVEPVTAGNAQYVIIQIEDITDRVKSEYTMTSLISELKKGYDLVKEAEEYNRMIAFTDSLTGLMNRHAITQEINDLFENFTELSEYALLFLDIDGFKKVNDTYGHLVGDGLLREFAKKVTKVVRHDDYVARLGGDEFIVLLKSIHNCENAVIVAKKLIQEFSEPIQIDEVKVNITASIGVAMFDNSIDSASEIIRRADAAMYEAKRGGKNRYEIYNQ